MTEQKKERTIKIYEKHGYKLNIPANCLEKEDKAKLGGGLRCFGKVYQRDINGNKIRELPKRRCGNPAIKGSLFCKKCGGGNTSALTHGKYSSVAGSMYVGAFQYKLGSFLDAFMNDPAILDLIPELSALRLVYSKYLEKLSSPKIGSPRRIIKVIKNILRDRIISDADKFVFIKDICSKEQSLTDFESIDLMRKLTETIGNTIERMYKIQTKDDFLMTPDGLKLLLRCIVDILKENVSVEILGKIKQQILDVSLRTRGDLRKYVKEEPKMIEGEIIK